MAGKDEVDALKSQLASRDETIISLQAQLAERDRAIGVLKEKTKEYIQKINGEHHSAQKKLEEDNSELQRSLKDLVEERVQLKDRVSSLEGSLRGSDEKSVSLQRRVEELVEEVASLSLTVRGKDTELAEYLKSTSDLEAELREMRGARDMAERALISVREETANEMKELTERLAEERQRMEASAAERVRQHEAEVGELRARMTSLDSLGDSHAEADALRARVAEMTALAEQTTQEKTALEVEVSGLQARVAEYEGRLDSLGDSHAEADALRARVAEMTALAEQTTQEKTALEVEVSGLQARIAEYEGRLDSLGDSHAEADALRARVAEIASFVEQASQPVNDGSSLRDSVAMAISKSESSIVPLELRIDNALAKMQAQFKQTQNLQEELRTMKKTLVDKVNELTSLTATLQDKDMELAKFRQSALSLEANLKEMKEARGTAERTLISVREEMALEKKELTERLAGERQRIEASAAEKLVQYKNEVESMIAAMSADKTSTLNENSALQQKIQFLESQYSGQLSSMNIKLEVLTNDLKERDKEIFSLREILKEQAQNEENSKRLLEESQREIEVMRNKRMNAKNDTIELALSLDKMRSEAADLNSLIKYNLIPLVYEQINVIESLLMGFDVIHSYLVTRTKGKRIAPPKARSRSDGSRINDTNHGSPLEHAQTLQSELYRLQTGITLMNQSLQSMHEVIENDSSGCCGSKSIFEMVDQSPSKSRGYRTLSSQENDRVKLTLMRDESN